MTLKEQILNPLTNWQPESGNPTVQLQDSGWNVTFNIDCADVVGCRLWEIALSHKEIKPDILSWAKHISENVTGLLEPLQLLEIDNNKQTALMRSETPSQEDTFVTYYEIKLQGDGQATFQRYQGDRSGKTKRQQIAFTLTHEVLVKLVSNLIPS